MIIFKIKMVLWVKVRVKRPALYHNEVQGPVGLGPIGYGYG